MSMQESVLSLVGWRSHNTVVVFGQPISRWTNINKTKRNYNKKQP